MKKLKKLRGLSGGQSHHLKNSLLEKRKRYQRKINRNKYKGS